MKVCFIAGTLGRGGAERQLLYMLQALQSGGIDTRVLCLTRGEAYEREIEKLGIEVEWVGSSKNRILRLMKIVTNIRKRPVDVLQSCHFYTNIYAGAAGRILGIPNIGAIRSDLAHEFVTNRFYGNWQLRLPGHLISNSAFAMKRAVSRGIRQRNIDILTNVVDTNPDGKDNSRKERGHVNILFAGRLSKEKRPELFIDLAVRLLSEFPQGQLSFQVAGDGPLRPKLERLASEKRLQNDQMKFLGEQSGMTDVYNAADILVSTSAHEGTPNVILEAMAHGIPVVATQVGGVTEILGEGRGMLVQPEDLDGLVLASKLLIRDKSLRRHLAESGKKYIGEHHSLGGLQVRLIEIYAKLTGGSQTHD